jgi:3-deoxy-alpha-D-manno-octulosonate 8-oxidase
MKPSKNVLKYYFYKGAIFEIQNILKYRQIEVKDLVVYFIDQYFEKNTTIVQNLPIKENDIIIYVNTVDELTTTRVNNYNNLIASKGVPKLIIAIGGGTTLDSGKAVANLINNPGPAESYQGWDLVKNQGIYKIGIPTLSGTGAEASRTCVMINPKNGLKLGMNSEYSIYDELILDPDLTKTVERNQYFYSGMDTYIHSIESLRGNFRHSISDSFSKQSIDLCLEIFNGKDDMMTDLNREKMMVASYLGGASIANTFVGLIHPFSAGLSVVFGIHHCEANCITMRAMKEFYPEEYNIFWKMVDKQKVEIKSGLCQNLTEKQYLDLYNSTIIHEKPLINALGENYKDILTLEKVTNLFKLM